jgi:three-Cys-motif partner protein
MAAMEGWLEYKTCRRCFNIFNVRVRIDLTSHYIEHFPNWKLAVTSNKTDSDYWSSYTALQAAKHGLLRRYLGGWFPILATFNGRVLYADCHAGRGRHEQGEAGSPLIALSTLLSHRDKDRILSRCEVRFILMELNPEHVANLEIELHALGQLPKKLTVEVIGEDYESVLERALAKLAQKGQILAPSFFFVDPYGFKLRMDLMRKLLAQPSSEVLITFMVRYIDMAIVNPAEEANMDLLFGTPEWRALRNIPDPTDRHVEIIRLYTQSLGCSHSSVLQMRGEHRELKYSLIYATNHPRGRELMKTAMWKVTPDGSFTIYQSDDPRQQILITPEPNLQPLEVAVTAAFNGRTVRYQEIHDWLLPYSWDYPHLHDVLRKLRKNREIECSGYEKRFAFDKNPLITFKTG